MTRTDNFRKKLAEAGLDAAIILDELNQHYLSGFEFSDGLLLITQKKAYLITDFRYYEMAQKGAFSEYEVIIPDKRKDTITEILTAENVKRIGFEGSFVPYKTYSRYVEDFGFCEFVSIGTMVEELREIKDSSEISKMQKAQDITDAAFSALMTVITPEMTEIEVAAELEYRMRRMGASGFAFSTIAVSGDASALPHGVPRNVKLKKGFLTLDFGAKYDGYCADMTRTVVIGRADSEIKHLYNTVLSAQTAALEFLKAGADAGEADKVARDIIDSYDAYKGSFGHSLGHGVGLYIHESPRLSKLGFGRKLRVGEIVTVEPGIYLYGKYGCRIEDMVAIEEGGILDFAHSTKELIEIL